VSDDVEHLEDLLSTASLFEQVVCLWSLVMSEKGAQLQHRFQRHPKPVIDTMSQTLHKPFEHKVDLGHGVYGTRELDVRPEVRLRTMISVTDNTRSSEALQATVDYSRWLVSFWSQRDPDFREGVGILRALDHALWESTHRIPHEELISALLSKLIRGAGSRSIVAVVQYARDGKARWSQAHQQMLVIAFDNYLKDEFRQELDDCNDKDGCEYLLDRLEEISSQCDIDVGRYEAAIRERMDELPRPEDEEDRSTRQWEGSVQPQSEQMQALEVRRIFDGLR
jgi:hypothetical protein